MRIASAVSVNKIIGCATLVVSLSLSGGVGVAEEGGNLAERARDPTQPLTAFQVRVDYVSDFHNLADGDMTSIVLNPIIPWKWGDRQHIARITGAYVADGPDWATLEEVGEGAQGGIPPNYVPTANKSGLSDITAVDVMIFDAPFGRQGIGATVVLPTASDSALGSEKWSIGPAYVAMTKIGKVQGGFLAQWLFSVAGDKDRDDINSLVFQPFAGIGLGNNWSLNTSEMIFNYDLERSRWNSLPLGIRLEKLVQMGNLPVRVFVDYEHNFQDSGVGPKNIFRLGFVPLL